MDLMLVIYENKLHYVYIKGFNRFMFHKIKNKNKKTFAKIVYSILVVKLFRQNIKKFDCMFLSCHIRFSE